MKAHCVHKSQYTCFLTTRVTAELMGMDYTSSLRRSRKRRLKSEAQQTSSNVNKKSKTGD